jgi:multisubunit Na+/H+ antiporter MnhB subunit
MTLAIDALLALGLLLLAWQSLAGRSLFRGIVMYVVFGLVLALAWARLGSPDLAMAEAAIGAGVTGALLMVAYWRLKRLQPSEPADLSPARSRLALGVAVLAGALVAAIGLAALQAIGPGGEAGYRLAEALPATGLGNPITGVLVIFRNLDTLLEMAVLLAAYIASRAALGDDKAALPLPPDQDAPLVGALVAVLAPLTVLLAVYLLKAGGQLPGGAFQGGAMLGAGGVLLMLAGRLRPAPGVGALLGGALVAGTVVFALVGLAMMALGQPLLAIPGVWAVYLIETAMMVSIGVTLVLLFAGAPGLGIGHAGHLGPGGLRR